MQKIVMWALFVLSISISGLIVAATVDVGSNGELRAKGATVWQQTDVVIASDVFVYGDEWKKAYAYPGVVVSIKKHLVRVRDGFFHVNTITQTDIGIVYDANGVHLVRGVESGSETSFNPFLLLWLVSVVAMTEFVLRGWRGKDGSFMPGAFIFTIFVTLLVVVTAIVFVVSAFASLAAFVVSVFTVDIYEKKSRSFFIGAYYISMLVGLAAFLLH